MSFLLIWKASPSAIDWKVLIWPTCFGGLLILSIGVTYTMSLHYTAPAVNNTLGSTDCVWVYFMSVAVLKIDWEWIKVMGIGIALGGVVMISFGPDNDDGETTFGGICIILFSTFLYSIFAIYLKIVSDNYFV
eukprot:UN28986